MHDQTLFRPWGVVDPAFWAGAEVEEAFSPVEAPAAVEVAAAAVSGDVAEQLAAIQAASSVDLVRANVLAEELDAKTTAAHGDPEDRRDAAQDAGVLTDDEPESRSA